MIPLIFPNVGILRVPQLPPRIFNLGFVTYHLENLPTKKQGAVKIHIHRRSVGDKKNPCFFWSKLLVKL